MTARMPDQPQDPDEQHELLPQQDVEVQLLLPLVAPVSGTATASRTDKTSRPLKSRSGRSMIESCFMMESPQPQDQSIQPLAVNILGFSLRVNQRRATSDVHELQGHDEAIPERYQRRDAAPTRVRPAPTAGRAARG